MKYLCPECERLVEPSDVHDLSSAVELRCPKCGAAERVEKTRHKTPSPRQKSGENQGGPYRDEGDDARDKCPKCFAPRGDEPACPKCGLVYDLWADQTLDAPEALTEEWKRLESRWDDDDAHQRFVQRALEADSLAYAARCYRSRDDEKAREQLEQLTQIGVQAMQMSETPGRLNPKVIRAIGWTVFVVLCLTLAAVLFSFH